jgi:hypothetical protein
MASLERPTGACVGELTATKSVGGITALHYGTHSTAKHLLAAACDGGSVFVWDTEQRAVQAQFVGASFFPTIVVLETSLTVTGPQSRLFARDMGLTRFGATTSASQLKKKKTIPFRGQRRVGHAPPAIQRPQQRRLWAEEAGGGGKEPL